MKQQIISNVMQGMLKYLNNAQAIQLQRVLEKEFGQVEILEYGRKEAEIENDNLKLTEFFLAAKRVEGCSEKSLT